MILVECKIHRFQEVIEKEKAKKRWQHGELEKGIRAAAGPIHVGADGWAAHAGTQRVRSIAGPFARWC
jgi:hypothetical protein